MKNHFKKLFHWNDWANREALASMSGSHLNGDALKTLSHILSAEHLWFDRINSRVSAMPVWPSLSTQQCLTEIDRLRDIWDGLLKKLTDAELKRAVSYRNTKGEPFTCTVEEIITHVLFHGAYHRGQIAKEVRKNGATPALTDYIHAVRTGVLSE
jgi:uncharacterized damage-inducible protein DinB